MENLNNQESQISSGQPITEDIDYEELMVVSKKLDKYLSDKHKVINNKHPYDLIMKKHYRLVGVRNELQEKLSSFQEEDRLKKPIIKKRRWSLMLEVSNCRDEIATLKKQIDDNYILQQQLFPLDTENKINQNKTLVDKNLHLAGMINQYEIQLGVWQDRLKLYDEPTNFSKTCQISQEIESVTMQIDKVDGLGSSIEESIVFLHKYQYWLDAHRSRLDDVHDFFHLDRQVPEDVLALLPASITSTQELVGNDNTDLINDCDLKKSATQIYRYNEVLLTTLKKILITLAYYQKNPLSEDTQEIENMINLSRTICKVYIDNFDYLNRKYEQLYTGRKLKKLNFLGDGCIAECLFVALLNKYNYFSNNNCNVKAYLTSETMDFVHKTDLLIVANPLTQAQGKASVYKIQLTSDEKYLYGKSRDLDNLKHQYTEKRYNTWKHEVALIPTSKYFKLLDCYLQNHNYYYFRNDHIINPLKEQLEEISHAMKNYGNVTKNDKSIPLDTLAIIEQNYLDLLDYFG